MSELNLKLELNPEEITQIIKHELKNFEQTLEIKHTGTVIQVNDGIARIYGLSEIMNGELVEFANGSFGMAINLETNNTGVVLLSNEYDQICEGDQVYATGKMLEVPVGHELLGRIINAMGEPLDQKGKLNAKKFSPIEKQAPSVIMRLEVNKPLQTGIKAIDAMIPIGRGQRELIIGDRQTGKTAICIDTIINQKDQNILCIYVAIGQKMSSVTRITKILEEHDAMSYTCIVVASASDSAPLQYIAPYTGCTIAEEFMSQGRDVLIIYDDLSKHAVAYRTMSLLLRRPPGREAYPGDVFYLHSRLLERAAHLSQDYGGGSITALPIVETQSGDVSAYIPTNVISITDGQIYLESELFNSGIRPAINPGLSVSRVGGSAQIKAIKKIAGPIRIDLAQYRELEAFSQFGSELDQDTRERLDKGKRLLEVFKQKQYAPLSIQEQIIILYAATNNFLNHIELNKINTFEKNLLIYMYEKHQDILEQIKIKKELSKELEDKITKVLDSFVAV